MGKIKLVQAGVQTTIQDNGRFGYQSYGISVGGSMSVYLGSLANILVGNKPGMPVLEIVQSPNEFLTTDNCVVSFCGGGLTPTVNGQELSVFEPVFIDSNSLIQLKKPAPGFRMYMAVEGGFKADLFLNSYSTYLSIKAGGYEGRLLKKNDELEYNEPSAIGLNMRSLLKYNFYFKPAVSLLPDISSRTIRLIKGNEFDLLTSDAIEALTNTAFKLGNDYNRMGYRLQGKVLELKERKEMISTAVCKGTVQLVPGGQLIALMADCQAVGGYPRIAKIIEADFIVCSQLKPGDEINFSFVSLQEAEQLYLKQQQHLQLIQDTVAETFS